MPPEKSFAALFGEQAECAVAAAGALRRELEQREGRIGAHVIFGALAGAIVWKTITWGLGLPSSSSQAPIGELTGAGGETCARWECASRS